MSSLRALQQHITGVFRRISRFRRDGSSEMCLQEVGATSERQTATCSTKDRPPPPVRHCLAHVSEYCRSASIDGLRYVGDEQRPIVERLLWVFLCALSLVLCGTQIHEVWLKWHNTPVIVTFAETTTPVWELPFPAVTICSETKAQRHLFNYSYAHFRIGNLTEYEYLIYRFLALVCGVTRDGLDDVSEEDWADNLTVHVLKNLAPPMHATILRYKWRNKLYNTSDGFRQMMTQDGLCFTFNILDEEDIYSKEVVDVMKRNDGNEDLPRRTSALRPDHRFEQGSGLDTYPVRAMGPGRINGLQVGLAISKDDIDHVCEGYIQGFKVVLHTPGEVPQTRQQYLQVPLGQDVTVAIQPNELTTSEGLRDYTPRHRKCHFPYERRLRFFRSYTQSNCELECLTNITLERCKCVSHHMPRTEGTRVCGRGKHNCVLNSIEELARQQVLKGLNSKDGDSGSVPADCSCLPSCSDLSFDMEISQVALNTKAYSHANNISNSLAETHWLSILSVYFKSSEFIPSRRSELYGVTDFIANCGGLLGLFMGFSLLSLVEILYFFSARLGFSQLLKRSRKKYDTVA